MPASEMTLSPTRHASWVRIIHWIITLSFSILVFTGFVILMCHPRLYWGETGNDLTPALLELPISRNHRHGGYENQTPFFQEENSPISARRTYEIFNKNSWGRSLHFLGAWLLVVPGIIYLAAGLITGHFARRIAPRPKDLLPRLLWEDFINHFRRPFAAGTAGGNYGLLQKCAYFAVIFGAFPIVVVTGLAMSPAINAAYPILTRAFGGVQSARTIHFFAFVVLLGFVLAHVVMVVRSGFRRQMRAVTIGNEKV